MLDLIYALFVFAMIGGALLLALEALFGVPTAWNQVVRWVRGFLGLSEEGWPLRPERDPTIDRPPDEEHDHDVRQREINALPLSVARSRALHLLNDPDPKPGHFRCALNPDPNQPELLVQAPMLREFCARFERVEANIDGLNVMIGMQFLRELADPPGHFIVGGFEGTPYLVRPGAEAIHVLQRRIPFRGAGPTETETRYEAASIYHLILIIENMIEETGEMDVDLEGREEEEGRGTRGLEHS